MIGSNHRCKTTYAYDHNGSRVKYSTGTTTTFFANHTYNLMATTGIRHYFAGSKIIATMRVLDGSPQLFYLHDDHLGSSAITTNTTGGVVETLDYYPYGALKLDKPTGSFREPRKYIGQEYDLDTTLSYLNARYYDGGRGQFVSQDPVFLSEKQNLGNPQSLNSYNYAEGNPIGKKDPSGNFAVAIPFYYGAVTAPTWVPWVVGGIAAAGTYITADIALRNNDWGSRWGGTVPTIDPGSMGFGRPPMGPEDWQPNFNNRPPWMKIVGIGSIIAMGVGEFAGPIWDKYQSLTNRGPQAQQLLNSQFNSTSVQTRVQATQAYNSATGASTPQQQLWVTPNGAVINWNGGVVAPAP